MIVSDTASWATGEDWEADRPGGRPDPGGSEPPGCGAASTAASMRIGAMDGIRQDVSWQAPFAVEIALSAEALEAAGRAIPTFPAHGPAEKPRPGRSAEDRRVRARRGRRPTPAKYAEGGWTKQRE